MNQFFRKRIRGFLEEDRAFFDITASSVVPEGRTRARVVARAPGVMAGFGFFAETFRILDPEARSEPLVKEGDEFGPGEIGWVEAETRNLLSAERTALNILSITCGTATRTRDLVKAVEGTPCIVLDTRKTLPGLRDFQKYAVRVAGGRNHRIGLEDMVLIKDNHIVAAGGIKKAVERARAFWPMRLIEVEVQSWGQLEEAFLAQPDVIMLDNFSPDMAREAVRFVEGWIKLEASGGITPENARAYAEAGVNFISSGWITRGWTDISLEL
ncbi:MAG: carboxylating nicotinate-nucleotide diphosphorylase [candidate division WOR-3 bacterium]